jgi:hypothetical protein
LKGTSARSLVPPLGSQIVQFLFEMKFCIVQITIVILLVGCRNVNSSSDSRKENFITSQLESSDTLGYRKDKFHLAENFYLSYDLYNFTGKSQPYSITGSLCDILIIRGDSIIASMNRFASLLSTTWRGTLKSNTGLGAGWLAPLMNGTQCCRLAPGDYIVDVKLMIAFDNVEIQQPEKIKITILP